MSKLYENLKKVSVSNDNDKMLQEWVYIGRATRELRDGHCICSREDIKHVNYFYNIENGNLTEVGDGCIKRLRLDKYNKKNSKTHDTLLKIYTNPSRYKEIDVKAYLEMVFKHFNEKIDSYKDDIDELNKIYREISSAVEMKLYNNELMHNLLKKIINNINEIEDREAAKLRNNKLRRENKEKLCQLNFGKHKKRTYIDVFINDYEYIEELKEKKFVSWRCEKFLSWVKNYPVRVIQKGLKYKIEKIREKIRKEHDEKRKLEDKIRKEKEEKRQREEEEAMFEKYRKDGKNEHLSCAFKILMTQR